MNQLLVDDLLALLKNKRTSFRLHICLKAERTAVYSSAKAFYNHCHGKKACGLTHLDVSLSNFSDIIGELEKLNIIRNDGFHCRKQRADIGKRHKYSFPKPRLAEATLPILSDDIPNLTIFEAETETVQKNENNEGQFLQDYPKLDIFSCEDTTDDFNVVPFFMK